MTRTRPAKATEADFINLKFPRVTADCPFPTLEEWLIRAKHEYALFRLAASTLDNDDDELAARFRGGDSNAIIEFYDSLVVLQQTYKAGVKTLNVTLVHLLAAMARTHLQGSAVK